MHKSLSEHDNPAERLLALKSVHVSPERLMAALRDQDPSVSLFAAQHPLLPAHVVSGNIDDLPEDVQLAIQHRPDYPTAIYKSIGYVVYPHLGQPSIQTEPMARSKKQIQAMSGPTRAHAKTVYSAGNIPTPGTQRKMSVAQPVPAKPDPANKLQSQNFAATTSHEAQHTVFASLKQKYGLQVGRKIVDATIAALPAEDRAHLENISKWHIAAGKYTDSAPEERIAYLHNYTSDMRFRGVAHANMGIKGNIAAERLSVQHAKKIAQKLQLAAANMKPEHVGIKAVAKSEPLENMGFDVQRDLLLQAAGFLGGCTPDEDAFLCLIHEGWDIPDAALAAAGLPATWEYLESLKATVELQGHNKKLHKSDVTVEAVLPEGEAAAAAVRRGYDTHAVSEVQLGGKHSAGTVVVEDSVNGDILLKPGSGKQSTAAGAREETASQSQREAAFWHVAQNWGLAHFFPQADLLRVAGVETAALRLLPWSWRHIEKLAKSSVDLPHRVLEPYLQRGDLHRWAVIDGVLGQTDRHGQNIMVSPASDGYQIALIDQGSALAGPSFSPGKDFRSFIPYYLRAWRLKGWNKLSLEQKVAAMPVITGATDEFLKSWVLDLREDDLENILVRYGASSRASLDRLALFKLMANDNPCFSQAINRFWVNT